MFEIQQIWSTFKSLLREKNITVRTYFEFGRFQTSIDSPAEFLKNCFLDGPIAKKDEG